MSALGIIGQALAGAASGYGGSMAKSGDRYSEMLIKAEEEKASEDKAYRIADYTANKTAEVAKKARRDTGQELSSGMTAATEEWQKANPGKEVTPEVSSKILEKVGLSSGLLSAKDVADMHSKEAMLESKLDQMQSVSNNKMDTMLQINALQAANSGKMDDLRERILQQQLDKGKVDKTLVVETIKLSHDHMTLAGAERTSLYGQLKDPLVSTDTEQVKTIQAKIADINKSIEAEMMASNQALQSLRTDGAKPAASPAVAKPAPGQPGYGVIFGEQPADTRATTPPPGYTEQGVDPKTKKTVYKDPAGKLVFLN